MNDETASRHEERGGTVTASAGGLALAARIVAHIAQLGLLLVAARLLSPTEFGIFALGFAAFSILYVTGAAGWREFLLGWEGDERAVNHAITYSVLSGYALMGVGVICAAVAIVRFDAVVITAFTLVLSATLLIAPIAHALGAILVRRDAVASLSIVLILAEAIGLAAGVAALFMGWNIVALAVARLAMVCVNLVGVLLLARWPVRLVLGTGFQSHILIVSRAIVANRLIGSLSTNAPVFVIGAMLGVPSVGYFRVAERIVAAASELLFEPLRLFAWTAFRQAAIYGEFAYDKCESLAEEGRIVFPLMIVCATPVFVGVAIIADDVVRVLLGSTWMPAAPLVAILAIGGLLMTPSVANEPLMTMAEKGKALRPVKLFNAVATIALFVFLTPYGLIAAALARLASNALTMLTSFWMQVRHVGAPWWAAIKTASPVYTGVIGLVIAVVFANRWLIEQGVVATTRFGAEVLIGALAYFLVIFLVRPSFLRTTFWL